MKNIFQIHIKPEDISQLQDEKVGNVDVKIMCSPFDIPNDVSSSIVDGVKLRIDFEYISNSEPKTQVSSEGVSLIVGKNSKRIYEILIPLEARPETEASRNHMLDAISQGIHSFSRRNNSDSKIQPITSILHDYGQKLVYAG